MSTTVSLSSPAGKWIMVSAILASSMAFIDGTALNVVLPSLQQSLYASGADLFWILNAYLLMLAALILIGGAMGDRLGRKKIFMTGIFIFIAGSAACGLAGDVRLFIMFRIVQGIGGALMIPGSLSLISSSVDEQERGKAIGTWSAFTTVVTMGGPVLGGALADAGLWRYIFFINIPIGVAALIILWRRVEESREEGADQPLDYAGSIAIALGLALVTFGFLRIPALGMRSWQVYATLIPGLLLMIAFVLIEKNGRHPMMPLQLFVNRSFSGANLLTFFLYAGLGAGMLFLSLDMVQAQGYSQLQSGLSFLPFTVLMISIARRAGVLADKYGPRLLLIGGPAVAGIGLFLLSTVGQTKGASDYWTSFFPGVLVFGLGMSFTVAPLTATVMGSVSDHFSGTASGINNALTRVANVLANAIFGALAVAFFSGALEGELKSSGLRGLTERDKQAVMAQAVNLGNAQVPGETGRDAAGADDGRAGRTAAKAEDGAAGMTGTTVKTGPRAGTASGEGAGFGPEEKKQIMEAYHHSFIHAYALILRISAGLAWVGSLMAVLFVRRGALRAGH